MATKGDKNKNPVWRESSSLIICAKSPEQLNGFDYRVIHVLTICMFKKIEFKY